jgi:hypothetical protein
MHALTPYIESVERYLLRVVPNLAAEWVGESEEEIAWLQALTPHPLPPFYLWFVRRMGHSNMLCRGCTSVSFAAWATA